MVPVSLKNGAGLQTGVYGLQTGVYQIPISSPQSIGQKICIVYYGNLLAVVSLRIIKEFMMVDQIDFRSLI